MLRRLSASPWIRAGLLVIALGFACYGLVAQWPQVRVALDHLATGDVAGAALAAVAALGCMMLAWRALLADLGSPLPLPAAIRVMFLGQLAKYVPGAVWVLAAQVGLAQDYQVPKRRTATAGLISMAITLVVGLVMAGITLPLASAGALRHYWWVLIFIPLVIIGLYPPLTKFGLDLGLRIIRQPGLEKPVSLPAMARAVGWTTLGWLFYALHAWLIIGGLAGRTGHTLLLSAGGYALAWAVGFLIIFFPGGIGPRELALIAVLRPVMPQGPALVVALASRVVMTAGDLAWAAVAIAIGRRAARRGTTAPAAANGSSAPGPPGPGVPARAAQPGSAMWPGRHPSSRPGQPAGPPNAAGPPPPAR